MANKVSGRIENKEVKSSNGSTLYVFRINGQNYSGFANSFSQDAIEMANSLNQGDEVEIDFVVKTSKQGRSYNNLTAITRVDRPGQDVQPVGRPDPKSDSMFKAYAKDAANTIYLSINTELMEPDKADAAVAQWLAIYDKVYQHISGLDQVDDEPAF